MVKDYLALKRRVKDQLLQERRAERGMQEDLSQVFKPITNAQQSAVKEIAVVQKSTAKEFEEGLRGIPIAGPTPVLPIAGIEEPIDTSSLYIGEMATDYLKKNFSEEGDKSFGINTTKDGKLYMGNEPVTIRENDIIVDGRKYEGTPGLWELITTKTPQNYTDGDRKDYANLLFKTGAIYQKNNPDTRRPKASRLPKYSGIIKGIWDDNRNATGSGLIDPDGLLERFDLLLASKKAGNTGVKNELSPICKKLLNLGVINSDQFKTLSSII